MDTIARRLAPSAAAPAQASGERRALARLVHEFDWNSTALGPMTGWSPGLRAIVRFVLANRFPMLLWWGPDYIQIYNDAYAPVLGAKHPHAALGQPFRECWHEVYDVLGPLVDAPFHGGAATWMDDIELIVQRHGFAEESHFTIAYSAVPDDDAPRGIGGVLGTVNEITEQVIGARRLRILSEFGSRLGEAKTAGHACQQAAAVLERHPKDVPFALLYLFDEASGKLRLAAGAGLGKASQVAPPVIELGAPQGAFSHCIAQALRTGSLQLREQIDTLLDAVPPGPWPDAPTRLAIVPIRSSRTDQPAGALVAGISARIRADAQYASFLELVANQVAAALSNARAYEEERRRAQALAQIDRAKTLFFSNVSHEFRTPLTLMLGPLADALAAAETPPRLRTQVELANRNAQRLLKLVNTLLEFARIEAGRAEAAFAPLDFALLTRDLASSFRAAMERAGLDFRVDCDDLGEPVYVDRSMWEKVVLNLLSNAFKFTLAGHVGVRLRRDGAHALLEVEDSGAGIAAHELPRLFERFHRIEGVASRTHEGSGIGLALVHEIVKLHGGTIEVDSAPGRGTRFGVRVPLGHAHIEPQRLRDAPDASAPSGAAYLDEALHWLPDGVRADSEPVPAAPDDDERFAATRGARVLLADDNADMRAYLRDLLAPHYAVDAVADGEQALALARTRRPDLILTDAMMPGIDGFALLAALRADAELREVPVIVVSARAGEESRIEGLAAGADDYVVKPFAARELLTRVRSLLELTRARREANEALRQQRALLEQADRQKNEFLAMLAHELRNPLAPLRSASELLSIRLAGHAPAQQALEIVARQITHLTRLVDDLLDISRITQGRIELRCSPQRLDRLIASSAEAIDPLLRERGHVMTMIAGARPLTVLGDPERLVQCIGNVLSNAAKYTPPGGEIRVDTHEEGGRAVITIADNGVGIAAEMLPRVFDLFAQGERTLDRSQGGLGVGLAIVKRLIEMHGGTVGAASDGPGRGARFEIRLPLHRTPAAAALADVLPHGASRRILVVDDNRDAAEMLSALLQSVGGHEVCTVYSGHEALDRLREFEAEFALVDIGLPELDGYELAQCIRAEASLPQPCLIAITGYGQQTDVARIRAAGFSAHFLKPVEFKALQRLLAGEGA